MWRGRGSCSIGRDEMYHKNRVEVGLSYTHGDKPRLLGYRQYHVTSAKMNGCKKEEERIRVDSD